MTEQPSRVAVLIMGVLLIIDVITYQLAMGTPAAPDPEIPTGLASGSSAPVGPWRLTMSDYTLAGDHYEVTVNARNESYDPADLAGLRFFGGSTNRNGFTDVNKQTSLDCAARDVPALPRTGLIAPGAETTGRVCLPINTSRYGSDRMWSQVSAYIGDGTSIDSPIVTNLASGEVSSYGGSGHVPDGDHVSTKVHTEIGDIRTDGPATHVTLAVAHRRLYRDWLLYIAAAGGRECEPGSDHRVLLEAAGPRSDLTGDTVELCVVGQLKTYTVGLTPRAFWEFPRAN
ncbi:hypothetical protein [Nocardia sp. CDC160]|uniref:hypothetical protein n=1 Tax=Nocardia sp. CDC160 TaxID=3112166 RepID=UPI002DBC503E|nr:hypothetical protein [Nocardia sp. CDC160]MEC3918923.1 hypothetical protein [Nocardia sp. CDC160]